MIADTASGQAGMAEAATGVIDRGRALGVPTPDTLASLVEGLGSRFSKEGSS